MNHGALWLLPDNINTVILRDIFPSVLFESRQDKQQDGIREGNRGVSLGAGHLQQSVQSEEGR